MSAMDEREQRAFEAVKAVIGVADSNFPSPCEIVLTAKGSNTASVTIPSYLLRSLLKVAR